MAPGAAPRIPGDLRDPKHPTPQRTLPSPACEQEQALAYGGARSALPAHCSQGAPWAQGQGGENRVCRHWRHPWATAFLGWRCGGVWRGGTSLKATDTLCRDTLSPSCTPGSRQAAPMGPGQEGTTRVLSPSSEVREGGPSPSMPTPAPLALSVECLGLCCPGPQEGPR